MNIVYVVFNCILKTFRLDTFLSIKLLLTSCLFILSIPIYSQEPDDEITGSWNFKSANFYIYSESDLTLLKSGDAIDLAALYSEGFPFVCNIQSLEFAGGQILVKLLGSSNPFLLLGSELLPLRNLSKEEAPDVFYMPNYKIEKMSNKLIITLEQHYGDSRYSSPILGKVVLTMVLQ